MVDKLGMHNLENKNKGIENIPSTVNPTRSAWITMLIQKLNSSFFIIIIFEGFPVDWLGFCTGFFFVCLFGFYFLLGFLVDFVGWLVFKCCLHGNSDAEPRPILLLSLAILSLNCLPYSCWGFCHSQCNFWALYTLSTDFRNWNSSARRGLCGLLTEDTIWCFVSMLLE